MPGINMTALDGLNFEHFCAELLKKHGFRNVQVTKASGDDGIDVIAYKKGKKYGFQCKKYASPVGNKAVQEVYTGKALYHCNVAVVITNSTFTSSAISSAKKLGVILWDGGAVQRMMHHRCPSGTSIKRSIKAQKGKYKPKSIRQRRRIRRFIRRTVYALLASAVLIGIITFLAVNGYFG